jgi:polyisoprenoid-binding protein YceI
MRTAVSISLAMITAVASAGDASIALLPGPGSVLNLYVEKTGLLAGKRHHFTFDRFGGRLSGDLSRIEFTIESASIVCRDTWVSEKDRAKIVKVALEDMLAASQYPAIRFESERISSTTAEDYTVKGVLSIRTVTRPLVLKVRKTADGTYTGEARFRLTDYGLKPPSAALGLVGTRDEVLFTLTLSTRPRRPEQAG